MDSNAKIHFACPKCGSLNTKKIWRFTKCNDCGRFLLDPKYALHTTPYKLNRTLFFGIITVLFALLIGELLGTTINEYINSDTTTTMYEIFNTSW